MAEVSDAQIVDFRGKIIPTEERGNFDKLDPQSQRLTMVLWGMSEVERNSFYTKLVHFGLLKADATEKTIKNGKKINEAPVPKGRIPGMHEITKVRSLLKRLK